MKACVVIVDMSSSIQAAVRDSIDWHRICCKSVWHSWHHCCVCRL